jgi:hypothetical protein
MEEEGLKVRDPNMYVPWHKRSQPGGEVYAVDRFCLRFGLVARCMSNTHTQTDGVE